MKILSWNIAGAHTLKEQTDDGVLYEEENLKYFIQGIIDTQAEMIGLQESHTNFDDRNNAHANLIAKKLRYKYYNNQIYGKSHIKEKNWLSLSNISKYKIIKYYFHKLPNPNLSVLRKDGNTWTTLDVGFLISEIKYNNKKINFVNGHMIPFHYYKRDFLEPDFKNIRNSITNLFLSLFNNPTIIVADFNYNDLIKLIPGIFEDKLYTEVFTCVETTPRRGQQDHILFSNHWNMLNYEVKKMNADHYQCIADVMLK